MRIGGGRVSLLILLVGRGGKGGGVGSAAPRFTVIAWGNGEGFRGDRGGGWDISFSGWASRGVGDGKVNCRALFYCSVRLAKIEMR